MRTLRTIPNGMVPWVPQNLIKKNTLLLSLACVYTAYTAPNKIFAPGEMISTRGIHYHDDDMVARQKKTNVIDVD